MRLFKFGEDVHRRFPMESDGEMLMWYYVDGWMRGSREDTVKVGVSPYRELKQVNDRTAAAYEFIRNKEVKPFKAKDYLELGKLQESAWQEGFKEGEKWIEGYVARKS